MTEAEWLACADPQRLLGFLRGEIITLVDDQPTSVEREQMRLHVTRLLTRRKSRLLACSCIRMVWRLLTDDQVREAIERVEREPDGAGYDSRMAGADRLASDVALQFRRTGRFAELPALAARHAVRAARLAAAPEGRWADVRDVAAETAVAAAWAGLVPDLREAYRQQCGLIRDIFGNPYRPVSIDPPHRRPAVVRLAQTIYEKPAFEKMPEVVDALEAAGCTDADILAHCRGPGPHVRGCWVVDLILGTT